MKVDTKNNINILCYLGSHDPQILKKKKSLLDKQH